MADDSLDLCISPELISKVNLHKISPEIICDLEYFIGSPGTQHYHILAYLSTCFNNTNIIELGTQHGTSAIALSYNESNIVHTFDIVDHIKGRIKRENIKFNFVYLLCK